MCRHDHAACRYASCGTCICKNTARSGPPASAGTAPVPENPGGLQCRLPAAATIMLPFPQAPADGPTDFSDTFDKLLFSSPSCFSSLLPCCPVTVPAFLLFPIAVLSVTVTIFSIPVAAIAAVSVARRALLHAVQHIAADRNLRILEKFQRAPDFPVFRCSLPHCQVMNSRKRQPQRKIFVAAVLIGGLKQKNPRLYQGNKNFSIA